MDDQRDDRESGGSMSGSQMSTGKNIALATVGSIAGAVGVSALLGTTRHEVLWIAGYCLVIVPLATWAGLILKKYLFPTH